MKAPPLLSPIFLFPTLLAYLNFFLVSYDFDYIIAGGGCAGLSLAYYLTHSSLRDKKILILDESPKTHNDKTWCYWAKEPYLPFLSQYSWGKLNFFTKDHSLQESIAPFTYYCINSLDFYQKMQEKLAPFPNVVRLLARVEKMEGMEKGAKVYTSLGNYTARWLFNSIVQKPQLSPKDIFLYQHFRGWKVKAERPIFDDKTATLMDFRVSQKGQTRFMYLLPFSPREALVEYTIFSEVLIHDSAYQEALSNYMATQFPSQSYHILEEEEGRIPMTTYQFPRNSGKYIIHIGTAGGLTKATTGYTFARIQDDAQKMVESLIVNQDPRYPDPDRSRFVFYDTLLLYLIRHQGEDIKDIFERLFKQNRFTHILMFLEEKSSLIQELRILLKLPWLPFLKALFSCYLFPPRAKKKAFLQWSKVNPDRL